MPNVMSVTSPYVVTGNPDTSVEPPGQSYAPGDLGNTCEFNNREYTKVTLAAAATGVISGQLAFWADRTNYVVTNSGAAALIGGVTDSFRNNVAGVFRSSNIAGGSGIFVLTRGTNITLRSSAATTPGMGLIADTGTTAQVVGVAIGTALGYQPVGVCTVGVAGGTCSANVDIARVA